jgi:hypothetical protein
MLEQAIHLLLGIGAIGLAKMIGALIHKESALTR